MTVQDDDDPHGAAQQRPTEEITATAQKPIEEEVKELEPPQTDELAVEAATSAPPIVIQQPIETVQQMADPNQATLQAFSSILAQ